MANKERSNFYRGTTLIVDNTKTSFVDLLELDLSRSNLSFEDFINQHQHQIYHLCYNTKKCCQCTPGYILPNNRILHYPQLEVLFDKHAKKPGHMPRNRSDFCCAKTKTGITTGLLDITLARTLLVNLCYDVFWYSCLIVPSLSLEDFLNQNKHTIYHLREPNVPCCQCPPGFIFPVTCPLLDLQSWKFLFNLPELPCQHHRMVPSDLVCTVSASRGIDVRHLSDNITKLLIEQCCSLRKTIDMLIQMRNKIQGHASEGRISDADYGGYVMDIESGIMEIAKVCKNEAATKQSLSDLKTRSLDETLCVQYQNMLLEQIQKEKQLEEKLDNIAGQLPEQIELALKRAFRNNMPDIVEQSVQLAVKKIYEPNSKLTIDQQRRKRKLLEDTFTLLKCQSSEDTFVETHVMSIAVTELEDKGMLVLTGTAGTGKSRNSLEILRRFSASHDKYCGIKLNNISEWFEIIHENDCLIVLIDDIFGRSNCIFNAEEEKVFDSMHSMIVKRCVKVIITMRNTIQNDPQISDIIDRQRIFKHSRFIDLSSDEFKFNKEQKRECLLKYCEMNKIRTSISITKQPLDDRQILDLSAPICLSEREIYDIANTDINPLMGYPESCYLFASNRKLTRLGAGFFKHPTKSLCNEIDGLRNGGNNDHGKALEYAILVYMALSEDLLDLHDINMCTFNKMYALLYHKKEFTVSTIRRGLGRLTKRYLKTNDNGTYSFQHRSIFESVLLSYNDIETEPLIQLLHIDVIFEMGRLEGYISPFEMKNEITICFDKGKYEMLAQKIMTELTKVERVNSFIERLCSSKIIRNSDENFIDELYGKYKSTKCLIGCTVHHLDFEAKRERFMEKIDDIYIPSKRTSVSFLVLLLKYSIKYVDNDNTIRNILKLMQHDFQVDKNIYINKSHEKCFTEAILQSCAHLNRSRLNMLWQFMMKNRIKFDKTTFHSFNIGSVKKETIAALQLLSSTVLTSDLIDSNNILTKAFEVDNKALVKLIFRQQDSSKIDVPLALYNACAHGATLIVKWLLRHFQQEQFDIEKALLVSSKGRINPPPEISLYQYSRINDTGDVVVFLLKKFKTRIKNLDKAMHTALVYSNFNICKILMENTSNFFDADAILLKITRNEIHFQMSECFAFVKYLVSEYSCSNVDVLLEIAKNNNKNFEIVKWIMSITENRIFYTASKKHQWIHKEICGFKLIYSTEFYKTLDVTTIIEEEIRYGNNDCIKFLLDKFDVQWAAADIVERICSYGDENLMQKMFHKFTSLNIVNIMNIAVKNQNLEAVKWLCTHFAIKLWNFESVIKEAINCKAISIISYFTEVFDKKYFNTVDILVAFDIALSLKKEDECLVLFKRFIKDPINAYRINDMLQKPCMKSKRCTRFLFLNCRSEFLHLNIALKTLLTSREFDLLKILLCKYDTTIFDMNSLICCIWDTCQSITDTEDITKWLLNTFDPILFDVTHIIKMACYHDNLPFFKWMYRSYGLPNLSFESLFIHACRNSTSSVLQWLFERITRPIDYKKVMEDAFHLSSSVVIFFIQNFELDQSDIDKICASHWLDETRTLEFQLCIFETYGSGLINAKSVFESVCRLSSVQEVNWLINRLDKSLLNFTSALKEAIRGSNVETFTYLFEFVKDIGPQEVDMIFTEACCYGNLETIQFLHKKYGESLNISVGIKELCRSKCSSREKFDVFKFLFEFSSPSILDCQLLMNQACTSGDLMNFCWLLEAFDPDIFEVRSAIHHAFNNTAYLTDEGKFARIRMTNILLFRCHCVSSDIQAVIEIACKNEIPGLMNMLVTLFGWVSFDFQKLVDIALDPMKEECLMFILIKNRNVYIDLQSLVVSVCKKGKQKTLEVMKMCISIFGLEDVDIQSTILAILDIQGREDFRNEVIKILLQNIDNKKVDIMSLIKKIYTSYLNRRNSLSKRTDLVIWILVNCRHCLIDKQETLLEMCKRGDFDSIQFVLNNRIYRNLVNTSCMHNAFTSGELQIITILIKHVPEVNFDKKVALNNASTNGNISVVQWLFHTYAFRPNRLPFLEPILDLKLARTIFDLNSAMLNACNKGNKDVVQWLLQIFPYEEFDMRLGLIRTSGSGGVDLVKWILAVYDNDIFDIETSLISACKNGRLTVVQLFIEKFGKHNFDIETVITEACGSGNVALVAWLHQTFDCKLYNIKSAMLMACINNRSDVVRWILKTFNHSYFNMQMVTIVANEWGRIELL